MSRIYDALKRAAEQSKGREAPASPSPRAASATAPPVEGSTARPPVADRPARDAATSPAQAEAVPESGRRLDWPGERLRAELADRVGVETWMRLEAAALRELGIGRLPRSGGVLAWLLEAAGGIALGSLIAATTILMVFLIGVSMLHLRFH